MRTRVATSLAVLLLPGIGAAAAVSCHAASSSTSPPVAGPGDDDVDVDAASDFPGFDAQAPFGSIDASLDVSAPALPCSADAGAGDDASVCPLPASRCGNDSTLVYFAGGACIDGGCAWEVHTLVCPRGCAQGGCNPGPTR